MSESAKPRVEGLAAILNDVRKELLDLGLRNPLLNYRLLKSRGLEVVDERPTDVFRLLVVEGKRFSFSPLDDRSETYATSPSSADESTLDDVSNFETLSEDSGEALTH